MIVAWVDRQPIGEAEVDTELRRRYDGPGGDALPTLDTAEGRQLRRWVIQVATVTSLLAHEADRRGLSPSGSLRGHDRAALGSIAAAALGRSPHAAAVFEAVVAGVTVPPSDVDVYRTANPELAAQELRLVRHLRAGQPVNGGRPYWMRRDDQFGEQVFSADRGAIVVVGSDLLEVIDIAVNGGPDLAAILLDAARGRAFARWLDVELRERVVLAAGSEHPADPTQPDHTHRH